MDLLFGLLVWLGCAFVGAAILMRHGLAPGGFALGLVLGPLGLAISYFIAELRQVSCSQCGAAALPSALICPRCQRDLQLR